MTSNYFCGRNIVHLEDSDVTNIPANSFIFVYRNGCGHCTSAKADFVKAKEENNKTNFFVIDTDSAPSLTANFKSITGHSISGVPMYVFYDGSKYEVYTGNRDAASIGTFLTNNQLQTNLMQ